MTKIVSESALPKLPDLSLPARPESGFLKLLGYSAPPAEISVSPKDEGGLRNAFQQDKISMMDGATGAAVRMALYALSARAHQHLSYLTKVSAATEPIGVRVNAAAFSGREKVTPSRQSLGRLSEVPAVDLKETQGYAYERSIVCPEPDLSVADLRCTEDKAMINAQRLVDPMVRRISFLEALEGTEVAIRDYAGDTRTLVADIRQHCLENHIPLTRIVLNGTVLWSAERRT